MRNIIIICLSLFLTMPAFASGSVGNGFVDVTDSTLNLIANVDMTASVNEVSVVVVDTIVSQSKSLTVYASVVYQIGSVERMIETDGGSPCLFRRT